MRRDRSWHSFALSLCLTTSLAACGADVSAPDTSNTSSAVTATTSYLVSFPNGTIPTNAAAIVSAAASDATIAASYKNLGIVLVKTASTSFTTNLRKDSRVSAVGASRAVSSSLEVQSKSGSFQSASTFKQAAPAAHPHVFKAPGSDPLSSRQWDMDQIHSPQARAINAGSNKVLVGVLDSGVDPTHPDLQGAVNAAASASCIGGVVNTDPTVWSNDVIGHGTHVSGIIAGRKNNVGIVGVAPGVQIAGVKLAVDDVNDPNFGLVFADAMICAIDWSVGHNVDVMNASLTIDPFTGPIDDLFCSDEPDRVAIVTMVRQAVFAAAKKNVSLVASTGNMFLDLANVPGQTPGSTCAVLPVDVPTVIGVSAVGYTQKLSWFSDYGQGKVDVAGPGGDNLIADPLVTDTTASGQVLSSVPPNSLYYQFAADWDGQVQDCSTGTCSTYAYLQGTSQAAPHATGVAALVISRYGKMGPIALLARLAAAANQLPCPPSPYDPGMTGQPATCTTSLSGKYKNFYGWGEVDALNVVK